MKRFSTRLIQARVAISGVAVAGLLASATIALASSDPYDFAGPGPGLSFAGAEVPIQCQPAPLTLPSGAYGKPPNCTVKGRAFVPAAVRRYLGLKSQTIASGTFEGPVSRNLSGQPQMYLYLLKFPASFARAAKTKHVIGMRLSITGTATYEVYDCGDSTAPTCGIDATHPGDHTQKLDNVQDSLPPASRYNGFGCAMFGGDLITAVRSGPHPCPNP